ncbi:MAG: M48 family metallopeptidase [Pseudonocardiaceae bacterium]
MDAGSAKPHSAGEAPKAEDGPALIAEGRVRLDPFALPSATTLRFILLIGAVLATSVFVFNFVYLAVAPGGSRELAVYLGCRAGADQGRLGGSDDIGAAANSFADCVAPFERAKAWWIVAGVVFLLLVAYLIYWWFPAWKIRRGRLTPLTADDSPELISYLGELVRQAGLRRAPAFLVDLSASASSGLAFGRRGRYYVRLNAGLITKFVTNRAEFRAVVMHELAHLRNADVDTAYLTVAIWWAFVVVAVVPLGVTLIGEEGQFAFEVTWRVLILVAFVYLTRNAVLRSREIYADVRACAGEGDDCALRTVLARLPESPKPGWRRLLRTHPDPAVRARAVTEPDVLFRGGFWEAAGAGLATTIAFGNLVTFLWLMFGQLEPLTARWLVALVLAPLAAGVAGIAAWRASLHALVRGLQPTRSVNVGAGLGLGLLLGGPLSITSAVTGSWGTLGGLGMGGGVLAALLVGVAVLLVGWIAGIAAGWLPVARDRLPRRECLMVVGVGAGLLALSLGVYVLLLDLQPMIPILTEWSRIDHARLSEVAWIEPFWLWVLVDHPFLGYLTYSNLVVLGLLLVWLVPLAAWYWPPVPPRVRRPPLHLRTAVVTGLFGGFGYAALLLAQRAVVHQRYPEPTRMLPEFALLFSHWQVALAVLSQMIVAAVVAAVVTIRREPFGVILGLVAAFVAGVLMTGALLGGIVLGGCVDTFSIRPGPCGWDLQLTFVQLMTRQVLVGGSIAAVVTALLGAAAGKLLGRAARQSERS